MGNRRAVYVTFGRDGLVLQWGVYSGVDKFGFSCPAKKSPLGPRNPILINGRRIFFLAGIHGASAWTCVPAGAVGNVKPLEVELWYDIRLHSAAMRRKAMQIVGTARLVR